jgi:hypothetical protein
LSPQLAKLAKTLKVAKLAYIKAHSNARNLNRTAYAAQRKTVVAKANARQATKLLRRHSRGVTVGKKLVNTLRSLHKSSQRTHQAARTYVRQISKSMARAKKVYASAKKQVAELATGLDLAKGDMRRRLEIKLANSILRRNFARKAVRKLKPVHKVASDAVKAAKSQAAKVFGCLFIFDLKITVEIFQKCLHPYSPPSSTSFL